MPDLDQWVLDCLYAWETSEETYTDPLDELADSVETTVRELS